MSSKGAAASHSTARDNSIHLKRKKKLHETRLMSSQRTFPPAIIASLDMMPSQPHSYLQLWPVPLTTKKVNIKEIRAQHMALSLRDYRF